MLHESIIARTASSEISQISDNKINLKQDLEDILMDTEVVDNPIPYTLETITIAADEETKRYYVDFESLMNYIKVNDETIYDTWKKLEDQYDIDSDDMYLVLPCKETLSAAIDEIDCSTSIAKHKCANSLSKMVMMIKQLKDDDINIVISRY